MTEKSVTHRYRLLSLIGSGASGEVYIAEDLQKGCKVAIKLFHPQASANTEDQAELLALNRCRSRFVLPVLDVGKQNGRTFIVTPLVSGPNLQKLLADRTPPTKQAVEIELCFWLNLLKGLADIHSAALIHRDLKPSNILAEPRTRDPTGSLADYFPQIVDFGFVKARGENLSGTHEAVGSLGYAAPEQVHSFSQADERSDLFSFAAILYRYLTGSLPYSNLSELMTQKLPPPVKSLNPTVSQGLSNVLSKLLSSNPLSRPGSAAEAAKLLQEAVYPEGIVFTPQRQGKKRFSQEDLITFFRKSFVPPFAPDPESAGRIISDCAGMGNLIERYLGFLLKERYLEKTLWGEYRIHHEAAAAALSKELRNYVLLSTLPEDITSSDRQLLQAAACFQSSFFASDLAKILDAKPTEVETRLRYLQRAGLLKREDSLWSFSVPLLRKALNEELSKAKKAKFHTAIAKLNLRKGKLAQAARHFKQAGRKAEAQGYFLSTAFERAKHGETAEAAADLEEALSISRKIPEGYLVEAAQIFLSAGKPKKALELLRGASREVASPALLMARGQAELRLGSFSEAFKTFDRAVSKLSEEGKEREILSALKAKAAAARALGKAGEATEAASLILSKCEKGSLDEVEALHLLALIAKERGDMEEANGIFQRVVEKTRFLGDRKRLAVALTNLGNVLRARGDLDGALASFSEALKLRQDLGDQQGIAVTYIGLSQAHFQRGDLRAASQAVSESYQRFVAIGDLKGCAVALGNRGIYLWYLGNPEEAKLSLRRARSLAERIGDRRRSAEISLNLGLIHSLQGKEDSEELLRPVWENAQLSLELRETAKAFFLWGLVRKDRSFPEGLSLEALTRKLNTFRDTEAKVQCAACISESLLLSGSVAEALSLARKTYEELNPTASPFLRCTLLRVLGECWREEGPLWADQTERHLGEALRLADSLGFAYESARTRAAWAIYLSYVGESAESLRYARQAREIFERLGANPDLARLKAFLQEVESGIDS